MEFEKKDKILLFVLFILFIITIISISILIFYIKEENYDWNMKELSVVQKKIKEGKKYNIFKDYNYIRNYPVFYINLDRSVERNELMKTQFDLFGINYKRIEAIDGTKIIDKSSGNINSEKYINDYVNLKENEIACTLSHIKAIREAYKSGWDIAFIMEDDCLLYLMPFWGFDIDYVISKAPKNWGILQLHIFSNKCKELAKEKIKEGEIFNPMDTKIHCYSTAVYIINKKGMRDILNKCGYKNDYIIKDNGMHGVADVYLYSITNTYYITIPLFLTADEEYESTIQDESHRLYHMNTANEIINMYKEMNGKKIDKFLDYQFELMDAFNVFDTFMKNNRIKYFLMKDTLLSVYREGTFINDKEEKVLHFGIYSKDVNTKFLEINKEFVINSIIKNNDGKVIIFEFIYNSVIIKIYVIIDNYYYYSDKDRVVNINYIEVENINFLGNNYSIFSPRKYLLVEYGNNWYIPNGITLDNDYDGRIIFPKLIKDSKKPILWCYFNKYYHKRQYYIKNLQLIKSRCSSTFNIIVIDDNIYKIISRKSNSNDIKNINPIYVRKEYIKFSIIDEYGGIFIDLNNILFKKIDFIQYKLRTTSYITYGNIDNKIISNRIVAGRPENRISNKILEIFDKKYNYWKNGTYSITIGEYNKIFTDELPIFIEEIKYLYPYEIEIIDEKDIYSIDDNYDIFFNKEGDVNFSYFSKYNMISLKYEDDINDKEDNINTRVYKIIDYYLR